MKELRTNARGPLRGKMRVPGDKSISHRALMFAAIARGTTRIEGLLFSEDVLATAAAFETMGVAMEADRAANLMVVAGHGPEDLNSDRIALDLGNSGTSMRLLTGLLAGLVDEAMLIGDESLSRRPMKRIIEPLRMMGAEVACTPQGTAPLLIKAADLHGIRYRLPIASAQLKSAILLAGLFAEGETWVEQPGPARDHTELMAPEFGVEILREDGWIGVRGGNEITAVDVVNVPGDISSAAFFIVAALTVPGSEILIECVGVNPTRTGLLEVLEMMGASIQLQNPRMLGREPVADLLVRSSELGGVTIGGELIVRAIDEVPALCVAAAKARGTTIIRDAAELRVKESDRIASMARMLLAMGVTVEEFDDGLKIEGSSDLMGAKIDSGLDHRVAMAAAVAGLSARGETVVLGAQTIGSSFPEFESRLTAMLR